MSQKRACTIKFASYEVMNHNVHFPMVVQIDGSPKCVHLVWENMPCEIFDLVMSEFKNGRCQFIFEREPLDWVVSWDFNCGVSTYALISISKMNTRNETLETVANPKFQINR